MDMCSFQRRYFETFACIAEPLRRMTKQSIMYCWYALQKALAELHHYLHCPHVLTNCDGDARAVVPTDPYDIEFGAVLVKEKNEKVIAYACLFLSTEKCTGLGKIVSL